MKKVMIGLFLLTSISVSAQEEGVASKGDVGLGIGLDYGGFGGKFNFLPAPKMALFAGLGYNLNGLGYNVGAAWRISPSKKACPTLGVMYGYNGVIVVEGASQYNKTYYGPSVSLGVEIHTRKRSNYWNLELILPFRPKEFTDAINALKNNPNISFSNEPLPVAFSVGYHWGFN